MEQVGIVHLAACFLPSKEIETNLSKTVKHFKIYMQAACCRRAAHVAKHLTRQAQTLRQSVGGVGVCVCAFMTGNPTHWQT